MLDCCAVVFVTSAFFAKISFFFFYVKEIKTEIIVIITIQYQIVALYVDDLILAASTKNLLTNLD